MRFGPAVADARRRADGVDSRRPSTPRPTAPDEVALSFDGEVDSLEPLLFLLGSATERLAASLRGKGRGALRTRLELLLDGGGLHTIDVLTAAPLADGRAMLELLRARLEQTAFASEASPARSVSMQTLRLVAAESGPLREAPPPLPALGEMPGRDPAAREAALARLRARLGDHAVRRAARAETGHPLARARWSGEPSPGEAHPWRRLDPPVPVVDGRVRLEGRLRVVRRVGRVERAAGPWWSDGHRKVELLAWAELDGPVLVLLRGRVTTSCDDVWELIAWLD
jgi:hypothetical protein